jgi:DNA-binding CsgD family transcriptional regulator
MSVLREVSMVPSYEPIVPKSMPPVLFVNAQGVTQFVTPQARRLCEMWNNGLDETERSADRRDFRLPTGVSSLLRAAANHGWDVRNTGVLVRHPNIDGLAVTLQVGALPGTASHSGCLLMFVADTEVVSSETRADAERTLRQLTPSERRVALLVAAGLRNQDIAERLQRSRRTVEYQLNAIFRKLDLTSRTQLVRALA